MTIEFHRRRPTLVATYQAPYRERKRRAAVSNARFGPFCIFGILSNDFFPRPVNARGLARGTQCSTASANAQLMKFVTVISRAAAARSTRRLSTIGSRMVILLVPLDPVGIFHQLSCDLAFQTCLFNSATCYDSNRNSRWPNVILQQCDTHAKRACRKLIYFEIAAARRVVHRVRGRRPMTSAPRDRR